MTFMDARHARVLTVGTMSVLMLLALTGSAVGAGIGRLVHAPPSTAIASTPFAVEIVLTGDLSPEEIAAADVVVLRADGSYVEIPVSFSADVLFGEIPGTLVSPPELTYYLQIIRSDGLVETAPPGAPGSGMFRIPVTAAATGSGIDIVSPPAGESVDDTLTTVAAVFVPPLEEPWNALVLLDGRDVTVTAAVTSDLIVLVPEVPLSEGLHEVTISALTPLRSVERSWMFVVGGARTGTGVETDVGGGAADAAGAVTQDRAEHDQSADAWRVVGRIEVGWTTVSADTTEADSLYVALPYDEVSDPTLDLYVSGFRSAASYLLTAQYDPVYSEDLEWQADLALGVLELEAGHIYPSISTTTLDWAAGLGASASVTAGRGHADLVALRISESDTLDGLGLYSRYALGGSAGFDWSDRFGVSLAHVSIFDDEDTVSEEDRVADALTNHVTAGIVHGRAAGYVGEVEVAVSSASTDADSSGIALHAEITRGSELDDHVSLELWTSETSFYSAGSLEQRSGESALRLSGAWSGGASTRISGWARLSRDESLPDSGSGNETTLNTYARTDLTWTIGDADLRSYAVARYDRSPGIDEDYAYGYASLGTLWRLGRTRAVTNVSWSRSQSSETTDLWTLGADLRQTSADARWSVRAAGRWALGSGDETDCTRSHYTLEATAQIREVELRIEYWLIEKDDRMETEQTYTVHVLRAGLGYAF